MVTSTAALAAALLVTSVAVVESPSATAAAPGGSTATVWHGGGRDGGGRNGGRDGGGRDGGGDRTGGDRNAGGYLWNYDSTVAEPSTVANIAATIGVDRMWASNLTGRGVGIALIDTGVTRVAGLDGGNVVYGPDLSFESQDATARYRDNFGHGTHLAGILVGHDPTTGFRGIAPGAKLTSVKVGVANGSVDVVQILAAVDWVVEHRNDDPRNPIRVITLAYGTDSKQDYRTGPLAFAVEQAWRAGIVVVVAGGNDGTSSPKLVNPAYDPYVLSVGAADDRSTPSIVDDTLEDFSSRGDNSRHVDVVAPGRSVLSLRDPGSYIDETYPDARVDGRLFKGSGTSQAAAVVAGAVADLLQARPTLTPDQVKAMVRATAYRLPRLDGGAGAGELVIANAAGMIPPAVRQSAARSTGVGSLQEARGSSYVTLDDVPLTGETDIFGNPFDTTAWAAASAAGTSWRGGTWMGVDWTGSGWTSGAGGPVWSGRAWSGRAWSGRAWSAATWSGADWKATQWGAED